VVIVVVDPTHRVLKLGTNASQARDSTIHPTATASCSVPTCYAAERGCLPLPVAWLCLLVDGLRPCWPSSRNALVSSALGSEHYCTVLYRDCTICRYSNRIHKMRNCSETVQFTVCPWEKLRGRKYKENSPVGVVQSVLYLPAVPAPKFQANFGRVA
jgi:hypothetical protein